MKLKKLFVLLPFFTMEASVVSGQTNTVIPKPSHITLTDGYCKASAWTLNTNGIGQTDRKRLQQALAQMPTTATSAGKTVTLTVDVDTTEKHKEHYTLTIHPKRVTVRASSPAAAYHAIQTLRQMDNGKGQLHCAQISDTARMQWRGLMIDVSRHFRSIDFLKRQIDEMALLKMNSLHLHLTDGAGWRMEIKKYPRLTRFAAWRPQVLWKDWWNADRKYTDQDTQGAYGGYYTQDELRQLVRYAADRYINIVPEIEMPAHSEEVLAAYPELGCVKKAYEQGDFCPSQQATYTFLENVLTEVMDVFPSAYIHLGGDEASMNNWRTCPQCQATMAEKGYKDVHQLQGMLMRKMGHFVAQHGRQMIGWDEILSDSVPEKGVVMVWRDENYAKDALNRGLPTILSPSAYCYLDYYQDAPMYQPEAIGGYVPLDKVYQWQPIDHDKVLGVQGNMWTEYIPTDQHAEEMLWPRAMAIAEIGWSTDRRKDFADFRRRVIRHTDTMLSKSYTPFDIRKEFGERPEVQHPANHLARQCRVTYAENAPYADKYAANGAATLTDGQLGGWTYTDKRWQGFTDEGMDVTIDLGRICKIESVEANFMKSAGAWVYLPKTVTIQASSDGKNYQTLTHFEVKDTLKGDYGFAPSGWTGQQEARYIRYKATVVKPGAWVFTDEIIVK